MSSQTINAQPLVVLGRNSQSGDPAAVEPVKVNVTEQVSGRPNQSAFDSLSSTLSGTAPIFVKTPAVENSVEPSKEAKPVFGLSNTTEPILLLRTTKLSDRNWMPSLIPEPKIVEVESAETEFTQAALLQTGELRASAVPSRNLLNSEAVVEGKPRRARTVPASRVLHWIFTACLAAGTAALFLEQLMSAR